MIFSAAVCYYYPNGRFNPSIKGHLLTSQAWLLDNVINLFDTTFLKLKYFRDLSHLHLLSLLVNSKIEVYFIEDFNIVLALWIVFVLKYSFNQIKALKK